MFENIIGRPALSAELEGIVRTGSLPPALLFAGPNFSGKLSIALELSRCLTCERGVAEWSCDCRGCRAQRALVHPYTLMTGGRYFRQEIRASKAAFLRARKVSTQYLFVRAVRKLTRRFDSVLWEGEEKKTAKVAPVIESLADLLEAVEPPADPAQVEESAVEELASLAEKLLAGANPEGVGVATIRRVSSWLHMSADAPAKIVIMERADTLSDSARNALLKTLEEPPPNSHLILCAENRRAILPTILSRVRSFDLGPRAAEAHRRVIERIFHDPTSTKDHLRGYFLSYDDLGSEALGEAAAECMNAYAAWEDMTHVGAQVALVTSRESARLFLEELAEAARQRLRRGELSILRARHLAEGIERALHRSEHLNLGHELVVRDLISHLEEAPRGA